MKIRPRVRRTLLFIAFALTAVIFIAFVAVVTPIQYRVGSWRRLPIIDHRVLPHLLAIFAAAFGAFFGSLSAFYLGRVQQRSDRQEKRYAALIAAQYALISQWNIVEGIRVQHLEKVRNEPDRFARLPLWSFRVSPVFIAFADLTFILETDDPNVLHEIHLAEQSFQSCVDALQLKNQEVEKFYKNPQIVHRIQDFKTGAGTAEAGEKEIFFLRQATDLLYMCVDRTLPRLASAVQKLGKLITSIFPGKKALRMIPDSPPSPGTAPNR